MSLHFQSIQIAQVPVTNRRPFRVSTHFTAAFNAIICRIEIDGTYGYGAGGHCRLTGETEETILQALHDISPRLKNQTFADRASLQGFVQTQLADHLSAAAALDIAIWDWDSRRQNLPLSQLLIREFGDPSSEKTLRRELETDMTIGLESLEETVALAQEYVANGFRKLKIKVGHPLSEQKKIVTALRKEIGETIQLTADANQGYTVDEAIELAHFLKEHDFVLLEQPVHKEDLAGLGHVTQKAPLPIFADEAAQTADIIERIGKEGLAHGIVLKLFKFGGLTPTLQMLALARRYRLETMIGCYSDTTLSLAAALHLALAFPEITYIDLDSHLLMERDPFEVFVTEKNRLQIDDVGLGNCEKINQILDQV